MDLLICVRDVCVKQQFSFVKNIFLKKPNQPNIKSKPLQIWFKVTFHLILFQSMLAKLL